MILFQCVYVESVIPKCIVLTQIVGFLPLYIGILCLKRVLVLKFFFVNFVNTIWSGKKKLFAPCILLCPKSVHFSLIFIQNQSPYLIQSVSNLIVHVW